MPSSFHFLDDTLLETFIELSEVHGLSSVHLLPRVEHVKSTVSEPLRCPYGVAASDPGKLPPAFILDSWVTATEQTSSLLAVLADRFAGGVLWCDEVRASESHGELGGVLTCTDVWLGPSGVCVFGAFCALRANSFNRSGVRFREAVLSGRESSSDPAGSSMRCTGCRGARD